MSKAKLSGKLSRIWRTIKSAETHSWKETFGDSEEYKKDDGGFDLISYVLGKDITTGKHKYTQDELLADSAVAPLAGTAKGIALVGYGLCKEIIWEPVKNVLLSGYSGFKGLGKLLTGKKEEAKGCFKDMGMCLLFGAEEIIRGVSHIVRGIGTAIISPLRIFEAGWRLITRQKPEGFERVFTESDSRTTTRSSTNTQGRGKDGEGKEREGTENSNFRESIRKEREESKSAYATQVS